MREYYKKIYIKSKECFLKEIEEDIMEEKKCCVVTANPEIFMLGNRNKEVHELLLDSNTKIVADGIGIVLGGKSFDCNIPERIPGVEICSELFQWANKEKKSLFLFGAKPEVVNTLAQKISMEYSQIRLLGYENGYVSDKDLVLSKIAKKEPDIVLVALGAPLQEQLIRRHMHEFKKGVLIGVGGSFDVLSGLKKRAPHFFVKCNLEWLYRITSEPKRLKRFWNNNVKFLFAIRKERNEQFVKKSP